MSAMTNERKGCQARRRSHLLRRIALATLARLRRKKLKKRKPSAGVFAETVDKALAHLGVDVWYDTTLGDNDIAEELVQPT